MKAVHSVNFTDLRKLVFHIWSAEMCTFSPNKSGGKIAYYTSGVHLNEDMVIFNKRFASCFFVFVTNNDNQLHLEITKKKFSFTICCIGISFKLNIFVEIVQWNDF